MIQPQSIEDDQKRVEESRFLQFQEVFLYNKSYNETIHGIETYWNQKGLELDIHLDRNTYLIGPNSDIMQRLDDDLMRLQILKFSYIEECYE
jgi:hypothetical protein